MKRREIIKRLEDNGYIFKRAGANHDIYWNPETKIAIPVKRHREIEDEAARGIFKEAGLK